MMNNIVLLVDDEAYILNALKRVLSEDGYQILTATSAEEGLSILANHEVQVVVSDQRMPTMSGSEFLSIVNKKYPDTIRVILSGHFDFGSLKDAINEGAIYKFITKPWDSVILRDQVKEAFRYHNLQLQRKTAENKLNIISTLDPLTGLQNRLSFQETLQKKIDIAKEKEQTCALLRLDIDRFKSINNTLGHEIGDLLLKKIANRLKNEFKENCVARFGNDEFAIIIEASSHKKAKQQAKKIQALFKLPFFVQKLELILTASIGGSFFPRDGDNVESCLKCANVALSFARELGGNCIQFYEKKMDSTTMVNLFLESELHKALNNHQFVLYYQPIVDVQTGKIVTMEALIRWQHPKLGLLTPERFLPICEFNGLIVPIGEWVLSTACKQLKQWHDQGHKISVAVNISARQFTHGNLYNVIDNIIKDTEIPANKLVLEITESMLMQNVESNLTQLQALNRLGVQLALDDFGTGYCSLSYLKQYPFNILKIDKYFIHEMTQSENNYTLVEAIIAMSKSLGLTVLAEGIETQEHLNLIRMLNVELAQGYFLGRPLSAEKISFSALSTNPKIN